MDAKQVTDLGVFKSHSSKSLFSSKYDTAIKKFSRQKKGKRTM